MGAHCQPCLVYHVGRAKDLGIKDDDIREAISIGHLVEKGAASAMRQFAAEVLSGGAGNAAGCCPGGATKGCCGER